jgi:aspartate/methionine/tyrosine aminotransferase
MDEATLREIAAIAGHCGAWILSDEVYRGLEAPGETVAAMADIHERGISVGSMSKAYSLAGLRLGWIAGDAALLRKVATHRDYNTISVGMIDDLLAAMALESRDAILARNRRIVAENRAVLARWVEAEARVTWVPPLSGTTALLRLDLDMPSETFCRRLLAETGVLLTPGSAFGEEGTVRIGYANNPRILGDGLAAVSDFLGRP